MGKKITPELVASYVKLVPELGERKAAKALGRSQSGMRAALHRSEHAPVRKDRRGNKKKIPPALLKRLHALKQKVKSVGGNPTAKYCKRVLKIKNVGVRTVQRELGSEGDSYKNRPNGKQMTETEMEARVLHCTNRLRTKFVYKGPPSARGAKRGIDCWMDCHTVAMPLEKAPIRSKKTWYKKSEKSKPYIQGQVKKSNVIVPGCKLFGGCFNTSVGVKATPGN